MTQSGLPQLWKIAVLAASLAALTVILAFGPATACTNEFSCNGGPCAPCAGIELSIYAHAAVQLAVVLVAAATHRAWRTAKMWLVVSALTFVAVLVIWTIKY